MTSIVMTLQRGHPLSKGITLLLPASLLVITPILSGVSVFLFSVALLTSLISFFAGVIEKAGIEMTYNLSFEEGVAILLISLGGKFYEWTSSSFKVNPGNHRREYSLNAFISNSIYLAGNRITPLLRFLDLIGVWHQSKPALHNRNEKQLIPAVNKYFEKMMTKVKEILFVTGKKLHLQEDEQHSRETRKRGQAPFCTAVIIESISRLIMARSHVQKKDYPGKALANICQLEVVKTLALLLAVTGVLVATFGVDGCTTALGVFTTYILKQWPLAKLGRDNWHKMKEWGPKLAEFCSKNTKKGAHDRLCPRISELFDAEKLLCYKIKKHFIYCANTCNANVELFRESFIALADHYADKFSIPKVEVTHFMEFLRTLLGKDLHLYIHGTHTSLCESFHSLCNKVCPKACVRSFQMYCMLKDLAIIQWNEKQLIDKCGHQGDKHSFRKEILNSIFD